MITIENNPKITIDGEDVQTLKEICDTARTCGIVTTFSGATGVWEMKNVCSDKQNDFIKRILG